MSRLMTASGLKVTSIDEGGPVVRGTVDVDVARQALAEWAAEEIHDIHGDLCLEPDEIPGWAATAEVARVGLFRWNPCSPSTCWSGGNHIGHLGYVESTGRGVWAGVLFR